MKPAPYDDIEDWRDKMSGNQNSGRKPIYLTIAKFNEFLNNHFFHLKVEVRVNTIINALLLSGMVTLLVLVINGG